MKNKKLKLRPWHDFTAKEKRGMYFIAAMLLIFFIGIVGGYYP